MEVKGMIEPVLVWIVTGSFYLMLIVSMRG